MKSIRTFLFDKIPIYPLITFRVIFGVLMVLSTARFMYLGWIEDHFVNTQFQFKYYGFEWIPLLEPHWMYAIHVLMLVAAIGVTLGLLYRFSTIVLFLSFTYTQLIDLTYYLNHYYFVNIVLLTLCFLPANTLFSLDVWLKRVKTNILVEAWTIYIIMFQVFVVYFFAGIAKMNTTWLLEALPLKIWLPAHDKFPVLGSLFAHKWAPHIFSWGGMLYDTFIIFFLLYQPTRKLAYLVVIMFHTVVGILFQIGVFPIVMMGVTLIFFSNEWHKSLLDRLNGVITLNKSETSNLDTSVVGFKKIKTFAVTFFVLFSLLFPLRYILYPGNVFWTEEGYRFSWRVMLMEKAGTATFYVKDGNTGREGIVDNAEFLNPHQEKQMAFQPDMILQFAHFLGQHYQENGVNNPNVRVEAWVTLNAAPSQLIVNPELDLMKLEDSWSPKNWIIPYKQSTTGR